MTRYMLRWIAAGVLLPMLAVIAALLLGNAIPEGWLVVYARRELEGTWTLHEVDAGRGVSRPYAPGVRFFSEPELSHDGRFAVWRTADLLLLNDLQTGIERVLGTGFSPVWAADNRRLAYVENGDIFVLRLGDRIQPLPSERITPLRGDSSLPQWSPDGTQVVYQSYRDNHQQLFLVNSDGSAPRVFPNMPGDAQSSPVWSPDGQRIAFVAELDGQLDIFTIGADGADLRQITDDPANDLYPVWSPDGARLAFVSDRNYLFGELFVTTVDSPQDTVALDVIARVRGAIPIWSADGEQMVYVSGDDGELRSVTISSGRERILTSNDTSHRLP